MRYQRQLDTAASPRFRRGFLKLLGIAALIGLLIATWGFTQFDEMTIITGLSMAGSGIMGQAVGDTLYIQDRNDATQWQLYEVTGAVTDSGDYATIPIAWRTGGSALVTNEQVVIQREATGIALGTAAYINIHVGSSPPGSPAVGDVWIDTT